MKKRKTPITTGNHNVTKEEYMPLTQDIVDNRRYIELKWNRTLNQAVETGQLWLLCGTGDDSILLRTWGKMKLRTIECSSSNTEGLSS